MTDEHTTAIRDLIASATIFASTVGDLVEEQLKAVAGDLVTLAQLKVLTLVARADALGVGDVAAFLGVSPAAASKTVRRLEEHGLLERIAVPGDRRTLHLSLTDEARRLLDDFETAVDRVAGEVFDEEPVGDVRRLATHLDRLSLSVAAEDEAGVCFRCSILFRDHCLLRGRPGGRTCYLHLRDRDREIAVS